MIVLKFLWYCIKSMLLILGLIAILFGDSVMPDRIPHLTGKDLLAGGGAIVVITGGVLLILFYFGVI